MDHAKLKPATHDLEIGCSTHMANRMIGSSMLTRWLTLMAVAAAVTTGTSVAGGQSATRERATTSSARCRGVVVKLSTNLQRAVAVHRPGTVFCIVTGVHRLRTYVVPKDGDQFIGMPGAVLNGSVLLTRFTRSGSDWAMKLEVPANPVLAGTCIADRGDTCQYANDVYFDNRPLRRVAALGALARNSFYVDSASNTLYLRRDPTAHQVEMAVATRAFKGWGTGVENVTIRALDVEKFANEYGIAAINGRPTWSVLDCTVRLNHGTGIQDASLIKGNFIADNGQLGVAGSFTNGARVEYNTIEGNNYAGFDPGDEAGGGKWVKSKNLLVSHNVVRGNVGPGLWTDGDSINVVYADNLVVGNTGPGIFHEISYHATIKGNIVKGNGEAASGWLDGAGILLNSSGNVEITDNVVSGNRNGIGITQTDRGTGLYGAYVAQNDYVHDNTVTMLVGHTGLITSMDDASYFTSRNNRFVGNHYFLGCGKDYFAWLGPPDQGGYVTWSQWRAAGNDSGTTVTSICHNP